MPARSRRFVPSRFDDVEDIESYCLGGFHPISIGDCFAQDRYRVLHKLGHGGSSTVWLARERKKGGTNQGRLVALKTLRADVSNTHNPALTIPGILQAAKPPCSNIQTVDHHFFVKGPNGSHLFLVSPFAGPSMLMMSNSPGCVAGSRRLRADLARKVVKQVAMEVHRMHHAGVVHGDITTSNILFSLSPHVLKWTDADVYAELGEPRTEEVRTIDGQPCPPCAPAALVAPIDNATLTHPTFLQESVIIADFGQSYVAASPPLDYKPATLMNYYPPEARFEGCASFEADVWALGCAMFEICAGFPLFSSFFGSQTDILRQTVDMLGRLPDSWWVKFKGRELWFEENGEPKSIEEQENAGVLLHASKTSIREQLRSVGTQDAASLSGEGRMIEKPGAQLSEKDLELLGDLLEKMMVYRPKDRIQMENVIEHSWLKVCD